MIKSMTGFGQAAAQSKFGKLKVEIRTLNNRFFDITDKFPEQLYIFEDRVRNTIKRSVKRGKVNINVIYDERIKKEDRIAIDEKIAKRYHGELNKLKKLLKLQGEIRLENMLSCPGLVGYKMEEKEENVLWPLLKKAIEGALDKLVQDRIREGEILGKDLKKRVKNIETALVSIKSRAVINLEQYKTRLAKRVKDLSNGKELDKARLETEVAIFAKNCDVQEEIVRIKSHTKSFRTCLQSNGEIGKKLDFIAQELHREINTIGSKASDFKISQAVIQVKSEIEKIREQVKNIE